MHLFETLADIVQPGIGHHHGMVTVLRHLGGVGLFLLAIVDGSPIPTFAGLDILTAILAARHHEPWYYYAGIATVGGMIGAYITFRMARKAGLEYLNRKFGERRVTSMLGFFKQWGTGALVVSALLPLPFPTSAFFAIAGVLDYPLRTFLLIVALARAARYGAIAGIASLYGRRFVIGLRHPERHPGGLLAIAVVVVIAMTAAIVITKRIRSQPRVPER